mmetsp:Transcript_34481/g.53566  ORF Transcript_34481/g.53566 Transcript_34481/m.53566 type:complete len:137 (-) Transcript_34481:200-610(-)
MSDNAGVFLPPLRTHVAYNGCMLEQGLASRTTQPSDASSWPLAESFSLPSLMFAHSYPIEASMVTQDVSSARATLIEQPVTHTPRLGQGLAQNRVDANDTLSVQMLQDLELPPRPRRRRTPFFVRRARRAQSGWSL